MPVIVCTVLLAVHALLLAYSAAANSATFDEPAHLAAGVEYWRRHDLTIYSLSPPLLRLWAAIPAVLASAQAPPTDQENLRPIVERHWLYADAFIAANFARFPFLLLLARLGMIPISCFAGWVTYRWAGELYGPRSAAAACAMYCLNPSILANGALVTTDVGAAAAMLASCWLWWRFCRGPSRWRWLAACAAVVAAHLCKFTALLLWPMMLAMVIPFALLRPRRQWWMLPAAWLLLGIASLILLNGIYGFRGTGRPLGSFDLTSDFMQSVQRKLGADFPSPVPRLLLEGFDAQKRDTQGGYEAFLFGDIYRGTHWYYYPAALLCKLPIAMLLLLAAAVASALARRGAPAPARRSGEWSVFLAVAVFAAGVMVFGDLNIGTRYLLPMFPLGFILISRLWSIDPVPLNQPRSVMPYLRDGLLAFLAVETLLVCPRFLTFVNFAVGGPANGWRLLSDSDFDWGQGLIDLRNWMSDHHVPSVALAYFGYVDPAVYRVNFLPIIHPGDDQYVAVSSYFLDGLENRVVTGRNRRSIVALPYSRSLQAKPPVAVVGHTIFIYSRDEVEAAAVESTGPAAPVP
ncbi:MAG TPA: glycosyltransferase family 39 protein [Tepidisphaeraceae bacterium]|nr:glycosyltransferase family 39 protein [Tepidisphaeraceae bacterium]